MQGPSSFDNMELERERGSRSSAQAARIEFKAADGENYISNLIDTAGHCWDYLL